MTEGIKGIASLDGERTTLPPPSYLPPRRGDVGKWGWGGCWIRFWCKRKDKTRIRIESKSIKVKKGVEREMNNKSYQIIRSNDYFI